MSLKATAFALDIIPQNASKFIVTVPDSITDLMPMRVTAASIPFPHIEEQAIWHLGRPLYLPKSLLYENSWSCTYYEDIALNGIRNVYQWMSYFSNVKFNARKIQIMPLDNISGVIPVNVTTLNYVFLKSVKSINLDWSRPEDPIKIDLTFQYSSIV